MTSQWATNHQVICQSSAIQTVRLWKVAHLHLVLCLGSSSFKQRGNWTWLVILYHWQAHSFLPSWICSQRLPHLKFNFSKKKQVSAPESQSQQKPHCHLLALGSHAHYWTSHHCGPGNVWVWEWTLMWRTLRSGGGQIPKDKVRLLPKSGRKGCWGGK